MFKRIKNAIKALLGKEEVRIVTKEIIKIEPYKVTRHQLGGIDPSEIQYVKNMTQEEREEHEENIHTVFSNPAFKLEMQSMIDSQVYWTVETADGEDTRNFGKGSINGLSLVLERFQAISSDVRKRRTPEKPMTEQEKADIL